MIIIFSARREGKWASFEHQPIPGVCGAEDNLINRFFIDNIPLDGLGTLEDLSDDGRVAWIGKSRQGSVDAEIVESRQN